MDFNQFAFWLLCSVLGLLALGLGWFLQALITEIRGMRLEMSQLNEKLAQVVTNQDWHGKELNRLDLRIHALETNQ